MWSRVSRKTKRWINALKRPWSGNDDYGDTEDESVEKLEHLLSQRFASDLEMQANGQWVSKSLVDALMAKTYDQKLLSLCHQKEIYRMESIFNKEFYKRKETLWSGCYSEVVKVTNASGEDIVLKISLINRLNKSGVVVQNGSSIVTDVINSKLLSDLKSIPIHLAENYCENFAEIQRFYYVWSHRSVFNKSEFGSNADNKRFEYFICQQTYGGRKLDSLDSVWPSLAVSLILQAIASLAVAEAGLRFEHRDLHLSNLLYCRDDRRKSLEYVIDGHKFSVRINGFRLAIIDTTFSRTEIKVKLKDMKRKIHYFYNDLSSLNLEDYRNEELKKVYLKQKEITANNWKQFCPKTNIIWLSYCCKALSLKVDKWCRNKKSVPQELSHLKRIQRTIDSSPSAKQLCLKLLSDTDFQESVNDSK